MALSVSRAIVVFSLEGDDHPLSRFMNYKHVFCAYDDGRAWIRIDSKLGCPLIEYLTASESDFDLVSFYRDQGYLVLSGNITPKPVLPIVLGNCVGLVKAFIGIRSWAITPYGLYHHLKDSGQWT